MTLEESSLKEEKDIEDSQRLLQGKTYLFVFSEKHKVIGIPQTSTMYKSNGFITVKDQTMGIIIKVNMYWVKEVHMLKVFYKKNE